MNVMLYELYGVTKLVFEKLVHSFKEKELDSVLHLNCVKMLCILKIKNIRSKKT